MYATVISGFVAAYLMYKRGESMVAIARKNGHQSGRLAGPGSQKRSLVQLVTKAEEFDVRKTTKSNFVSTLLYEGGQLRGQVSAATVALFVMSSGGVFQRRRLVCLAGLSRASRTCVANSFS